MQAQIPREALVVRFRPTDPGRVLASAAKEYRRSGRYWLSVFADVPADGEDEQALAERLVDAAGLAGIDLAKQPSTLCVHRLGRSSTGDSPSGRTTKTLTKGRSTTP
jgi:hypothetical protein